MFLLIGLGVVILASMIYLAISRRSSPLIKIAALVALALMIITIIICLIFFFTGPAAPRTLVLPDTLPSEMPAPAEESNPMMLVMFIVFLLALFVTVLLVSLRGQDTNKDKDNW